MAVDAIDARLIEIVARAAASDAEVIELGPPIVESCLFCDFAITAPVAVAREAWREHDCERPRPPARRRHTGFQIRR